MQLIQFQNSELYAFGGYSNRNGATTGIIGTDHATTAVYPNGFLPEFIRKLAIYLQL
jgi:hypothetical protein